MHLQEVTRGKRWLVIVDDVWDSAHAKMLDFDDTKSSSRTLITTRFSKMIPGASECLLGLLSEEEATALLLGTAGLVATGSRKSRTDAAKEVVELCGYPTLVPHPRATP